VILRGIAGVLACGALLGCGGAEEKAQPPANAATCHTPARTTPAQTEGPYYKAGPPKRRSFVKRGTRGRRLVLTGRVRSKTCKPVEGARVDFWQADAGGSYDNSGYRFRGYQRTDNEGRYRLRTVVPGEYPGRTRHIHVKVKPPGGDELTSQLYLPNVAGNQSDPIFNKRNLVRLDHRKRTWRARFDFVVP
jgi:protocatechuate 3,4-dioxygenase beta subunit